jgi:hypothetical protein
MLYEELNLSSVEHLAESNKQRSSLPQETIPGLINNYALRQCPVPTAQCLPICEGTYRRYSTEYKGHTNSEL